MKIAIIGSGVSGLTAAHLLHPHHDITVYESNDYIGGHVNTISVEERETSLDIDTGFIVFNDWTYPNFEKLIHNLDVKIQNSEMSFSAHCEGSGFEWSGSNLNSLVFNRDNWNHPIPYKILFDVLRFNKLAKQYLLEKDEKLTLEGFLHKHHFSDAFIRYYILPMGAAIWSSCTDQIKEYPASSFLAFFNNHGLLNIKNRPQWKTISGGAKQYVKELTKSFQDNVLLNTKVVGVTRSNLGIVVHSEGLKPTTYDHVFFACHSDQALNMLQQPAATEKEILSNIKYQKNTAVLHTDCSLMPTRREAWSAWNYWVPKSTSSTVKVTYYMNRLQNLQTDQNYFVTLNFDEKINPQKIIYKVEYAHPVFDHAAINSQKRLHEINGKLNTWYCGAYWRNGFHEDGVWSAIQSVSQFNSKINDEELHLQRAS